MEEMVVVVAREDEGCSQRFKHGEAIGLSAWLQNAVLVAVICGISSVGWAAPKNGIGEADLKAARELERRYTQFYEEGKYAEAIPLARRACSILEKRLKAPSGELAQCLNDLARLYDEQGQYEKAEPLYVRSLAIREKVLGSECPEVAESLSNLAMLYDAIGERGNAVRLSERALQIRERVLGPEHPSVAMSLNNLAGLYQEQGEYDKAKPLYERALSILEGALGPSHPDVAMALNNLASHYQDRGEYGKAERLYERSLGILEKVHGADHPDVAMGLNNLAVLHGEKGEYGRAELLHKRVVAVLKGSLGPEHPLVGVSIDSLATVYKMQGRYREAELLYEQALVILEGALGAGHLDVAISLNNLAQLHQKQGRYSKAELLYGRVLVVLENTLGSGHPSVASALNNLAIVYKIQGEYEKADLLYTRALAIWQDALGANHPNVATGLSNLAELYRARGALGDAEPLLEQALAILENSDRQNRSDVAHCLINLAELSRDLGELERAELLLKRALSVLRRVVNSDHPDIASALNNLAEVYRIQKRFKKAEMLHVYALANREKVLGSVHPDVARSLGKLSSIYLETGRPELSVMSRRRALDIEYEYIGHSLLFVEDRRRLDLVSSMFDSFDVALSAHLQAAPDHSLSAELALTTLLRRKGLVLDLGTRSAAIIRRSLPEKHLHLLDDMAATRNRYIALIDRGPGSLPIERFVEQLTAVRQEQYRLWREISDHSPLVETLATPAAIADIQRALPSTGVLVEYVRYFPKYHSKAPSIPAVPRYAVYLVFPDRFDWVDVGLAETIDDEVTTFRHALQTKAIIPTELHDLILAPVLDRLDDDTNALFIAPDAALNLVPFAALYDGSHYATERYPIHTLTTGRDLLHPWDTGDTAKDSILVVANPTGAGLGGTEHEADLLATLFPHPSTLLHDSATEAAVQHYTQPWLVHLGTHGFFENPAPDPALEAAMAEHQRTMSPSAVPVSLHRKDSPMMHTGLELADGRLTAYQISGWDLRGTELVVLSACGSGQGDVQSGEGIFGLRRAFAMAGARTQVMSLWDVADGTTYRLMDAYYRKLLDGKGRGEAMREVQLEWLRSEEHRHPGDWARFVVVGEWRPLPPERLPRPEPIPDDPEPTKLGPGCHRASIAEPGLSPSMLLVLLGMLAIRRRRRACS